MGIFQRLIERLWHAPEPKQVIGVEPFARIDGHKPMALLDGRVVERSVAVKVTIDRMGKRWCLHPEYTPLRRPRRLKAW